MCTCPLFLCNELSIIYVCYTKYSLNDPLTICIKWLLFFAALFISFWTGILNDKSKWRGIHGGRVAPKQHPPLYLFENEINLL